MNKPIAIGMAVIAVLIVIAIIAARRRKPESNPGDASAALKSRNVIKSEWPEPDSGDGFPLTYEPPVLHELPPLTKDAIGGAQIQIEGPSRAACELGRILAITGQTHA